MKFPKVEESFQQGGEIFYYEHTMEEASTFVQLFRKVDYCHRVPTLLQTSKDFSKRKSKQLELNVNCRVCWVIHMMQMLQAWYISTSLTTVQSLYMASTMILTYRIHQGQDYKEEL